MLVQLFDCGLDENFQDGQRNMTFFNHALLLSQKIPCDSRPSKNGQMYKCGRYKSSVRHVLEQRFVLSMCESGEGFSLVGKYRASIRMKSCDIFGCKSKDV